MKDKPAFPQGHPEMTIQGQTVAETQGMTMRQYYKAMAMQGLLAKGISATINGLVSETVKIAEAMLREDQEHGD